MTFDDYVQAVDGAVREAFPSLELVMANRPSDRFGSIAWRRKADAEGAAGKALPVVRAIEFEGHRAAFLFFGTHWLRPDSSRTVSDADDIAPTADEIGRFLLGS